MKTLFLLAKIHTNALFLLVSPLERAYEKSEDRKDGDEEEDDMEGEELCQEMEMGEWCFETE